MTKSEPKAEQKQLVDVNTETEQQRVVKPVSISRFVLADHHVRRFVTNPVEGTTLDDVLQPNFFLNVLHNLIPGRTLITVLSEDMSLYAELLVLDKTNTTATCRVTQVFWEPGDGKEFHETVLKHALDDYSITWGGPHHKHRILHGTQIVKTGFLTKEAAEAELGRIKSRAAAG